MAHKFWVEVNINGEGVERFESEDDLNLALQEAIAFLGARYERGDELLPQEGARFRRAEEALEDFGKDEDEDDDRPAPGG